MPSTTRSQARAAQPALTAELSAQQGSANQGDFVALNWFFFDRSNTQENPCPINIPHGLFNEPIHNCRDFFASALKEGHLFEVEKTAIEFWRVSDPGFS